MHFFKIVSTKEKNGVYFCVIPHQWEIDGRLYWPYHLTHSQREVLRCNASSAPEDGWTEFSCVLKCSKISNFKDALNLEKQITDCADTDAEEVLLCQSMNRNKRVTKKTSVFVNQLTDRNDLFDTLSKEPTTNVNLISQQIIKPSTIVPKVNVFNNRLEDMTEYETLLVHNDGSVQTNYPLEHESTAEQTKVDEDIQEIRFEISNIRNEIVNMKQQIKYDYQKININLDKIYQKLSEINVLPNVAAGPPPNENLLNSFNFPLTSCEEIHKLDNEIRNNVEFKLQLIEFLSKIGGTTREEDGGKVAYKIIDNLFHSAVLVNYSWTGVSRGSKSIKKKPFQVLQGILDVFFEVISLADSRHTKQKNSNYFKGVLKYAMKRSLRKRNEGPSSVSKPDNNETSGPSDEVVVSFELPVNEKDPNEVDVE